MTPKQAFEILLNIPEPRRPLTLSDAATALRVSELLALMWRDLDFADLVMYVRRAYVWGRFKVPKSKASKAPVPMHPLLSGFLLAWRDKTRFGKDSDFVFPSVRLKGKKPLSASIMVQKYLRPAAVKARAPGYSALCSTACSEGSSPEGHNRQKCGGSVNLDSSLLPVEAEHLTKPRRSCKSLYACSSFGFAAGRSSTATNVLERATKPPYEFPRRALNQSLAFRLRSRPSVVWSRRSCYPR